MSILIIIYSDVFPVLQLHLLQKKKIVRYFHILFLSLPTKNISLLPVKFLGLRQSGYQAREELKGVRASWIALNWR